MPTLFNTILTCSAYISDCPLPCLASSENVKSIDRNNYIVVASIGSIYTENTCIGFICAVDI